MIYKICATIALTGVALAHTPALQAQRLEATAGTDAVAIVIDGGTIKLNGTTWRLWGIDAPEVRQTCGDWSAGLEAGNALAHMVRDSVITCEDRGTDRYGRATGLCRADGRDLGAAMVNAGMAWAFDRYSLDYAELEERAKVAGFGVHAHRCLPAWEWRTGQRQ